MSHGDELKLQRGAAANTKREQGNEGGKNCDHAYNCIALARKSLHLLDFRSFEQAQDPWFRRFSELRPQRQSGCRHRPTRFGDHLNFFLYS
jgi:hypothetical protein